MTSLGVAWRACEGCKLTLFPSGNQLKRCARCQADSRRSAEPDEDTIYYLRTSRPHICGISVSGPYYPLGMIVPQVLHNLQGSFTGSVCFSESFPDTEGESGLARFENIVAPLDDEPGKTIKIEFVRERNPAVARRLPGPTYPIVASITSDTTDPEALRISRLRGYTPLQDMEIHGTCLTAYEAERAARDLVTKKLRLFPGGREMTPGWSDETKGRTFTTGIFCRKPNAEPVVPLMILARLESGVVTK